MMKHNKTKSENGVKDSLIEALADESIGMTDNPTLPLVGSENVPISKGEEQDVE